jgi:hypothetical protein
LAKTRQKLGSFDMISRIFSNKCLLVYIISVSGGFLSFGPTMRWQTAVASTAHKLAKTRQKLGSFDVISRIFSNKCLLIYKISVSGVFLSFGPTAAAQVCIGLRGSPQITERRKEGSRLYNWPERTQPSHSSHHMPLFLHEATKAQQS